MSSYLSTIRHRRAQLEEILIGSMLIARSYPKIASFLNAQLFQDETNRKIYSTIRRCHEAAIADDYLTLSYHIKKDHGIAELVLAQKTAELISWELIRTHTAEFIELTIHVTGYDYAEKQLAKHKRQGCTLEQEGVLRQVLDAYQQPDLDLFDLTEQIPAFLRPSGLEEEASFFTELMAGIRHKMKQILGASHLEIVLQQVRDLRRNYSVLDDEAARSLELLVDLSVDVLQQGILDKQKAKIFFKEILQ
jgi:replicative DNA helicase